jgi:hypothetical protein
VLSAVVVVFQKIQQNETKYCILVLDTATQQHNNPTTQQPNNPTTQQPNNPTTQQHNNTTTQQHNNPTTQQHNNTTTQQHNNATTQQPNNPTTQQHNNTTTLTHLARAHRVEYGGADVPGFSGQFFVRLDMGAWKMLRRCILVPKGGAIQHQCSG